MRSVSSRPPSCLLCGHETVLLYPSNVPADQRLDASEFACTSPHLSIHDDIYTCRACGLARSVPGEDIEHIEDLYRNVEDDGYLESEDERRLDYRRALEAIEAYPFVDGPGRVLEIGSSFGLFLAEAQARGWDAQGIEPGRAAAERARSQGLNVFGGTLEEFDAEGRTFDLVASWDVWEHLEDPVRALAVARDLLVPGGLLLVTTVNMGGPFARLFRGRWPWYMRMHLHYFTRESLGEMVRRAGFEVIGMRTQPKTLKLGYVLERAKGLFGPLAGVPLALIRAAGFADRPIEIDTRDILRVEARRTDGDA